MVDHFVKFPTTFDPETVRILSDALDDAWRQVKLDGHNLSAEDVRELLASHIIALAKRGERDHVRLVRSALARSKL